MTQQYGYAGQVLRVDLASSSLCEGFGAGLSGYGWTPVSPWAGLLQLCRQTEQCGFIPEPTDELHPHGQVVIRPVEGHGHCGLAGGIAQLGEENPLGGGIQSLQRFLGRGIE